MPGIFSAFFSSRIIPNLGRTILVRNRIDPTTQLSVPGPWSRPAAEAGLHLGPKTLLERVRVLDDSRRASSIDFLHCFLHLEHEQVVSWPEEIYMVVTGFDLHTYMHTRGKTLDNVPETLN